MPAMNLDQFNQRLGRAVREVRQEAGWTQLDLTRAIAPILGKDEPAGQTTISNWEHGVRAMSARQVAAVEVALGLEPCELFHRAGWRSQRGLATIDVIAVDPNLSGSDRAALAATYSALVERTARLREGQRTP